MQSGPRACQLPHLFTTSLFPLPAHSHHFYLFLSGATFDICYLAQKEKSSTEGETLTAERRVLSTTYIYEVLHKRQLILSHAMISIHLSAVSRPIQRCDISHE